MADKIGVDTLRYVSNINFMTKAIILIKKNTNTSTNNHKTNKQEVKQVNILS